MDKPFLEQIINHLEFLGYEVERKEDWSRALHERKINILLREYSGGILLSGSYRSNDFAKANKGDFLNFINMLNRKATVTRISTDDEVSLWFEAWFPGIYDKKQFGTFMNLWDFDTAELLSRSEPETAKFLK